MNIRSVERGLLVALLVLVGVLILTGLWLTLRYRPTSAAVWNDVRSLDSGTPIARPAHRWSAQLACVVATALVVVTIVRRVTQHERRAPWILAAIAVPVLVAASFTGYLLPWDQLGLWAVTVGSSWGGVLTAAFDDKVKFVLIGGVEVGQSTYRRWLIVHLALGTAAVVLAVLAAARARRRERQEATAPAQ